MESREKHLEWCKQRANELVDSGDLTQAYASMASDLGKHPETQGRIGLQFGMMEMMSGRLSTPDQRKHFINGFG